MNERIFELAKQARITISGYTDDNSGYYEPSGSSPEELEKFAELVVRECMRICKDHPSIIFKNEWDTDIVAPDIVRRLESHFGVEE
jgi:hypothetical protein